MTRVTEAHVEARRQSILDAAHRTFARRGIKTATMAEIAEEAGLSAGAIYRYFDSKEKLALACFQEVAEGIAAQWHREVRDAADPLTGFHNIARASFDEMNAPDAADHTRMMLEHLLDATRSRDPEELAEARRERETIVRGLADAIQLAQEERQLPAALDAFDLAQALMAFYIGSRLARLLDPATDTDAMLAQVQTMMTLAGRAASHPEARFR
jgi:AcrR family transcriptional regulator